MIARVITGIALGVAALFPFATQGQSPLMGRVVRAGSNTPIPGAEVTIDSRATKTITDAAGEFRFDAVPAGYVMIFVRRIGFSPESLGVNAPMATPIDIELREAPQALDTVAVRAASEPLATGKLAGFYERKRGGIGRFIEASDIDKMLTRRLGDIIVARMPGTRTIRSEKGGMVAYIATVRLAPQALQSAMRGATRPPPCYPDVYLDGTAVFSSGSGRPSPDELFDVNSIDPASVSAIEFYAGAAQMPAQYNRTGSSCGALLIWTK